MTTSITSLPSASVPLTGAERVPMDQTIGSAVSASALVVGTGYRIESLGTTNWTACGLPAGVTAAVGLTFVATAAGTGTGTAIEAQTVEATAAAIAALAPATNLAYDQATRLLSSSTGTDVTLPLATDALDGLQSAAQRALVQALITAGVTAAGSTVTIPHIHGDLAGALYIHVKNTSAGTLAKGSPVYPTGTVGDTTTLEVAGADSSNANLLPAVGLLADALAPNASGHAVIAGELTGLNTAAYAIGDALYVASGGGLTATRPTTGTIQQVAIVGRVNSGTGSVTVTISTELSPNWDVAYSQRLRWDGGATGLNAATGRASLELGTAAVANTGTAAGNVPVLDAQARLPAVDGSQLTGLPSTTPGGNTTQLQYNNAGTFAGLSTLTTDGTNVTISGRLNNSVNGAASAPPLSLTGTWFSGGTATTTKPQFLIEPAGATSNSFSTSGTGFAVNAPSGFAGDLAWFGVNGSRQASISSGGVIASNGLRSTGGLGSAESSAILFGPATSNSVDIVLGRLGGTGYLALGQFGFSDATLVLSSSAVIGFSGSSSVSGFTAFDAALRRDAANALAQRNGTAAQSSRIYNTFTSATNHERAKLEWISNVFLIGTEKGSGGGTARALELQTDGVTRAQISATGVWRNTQPAPAAVNVTATLTIANLQTGIITTTTAAAVDMTLPTGTDVEGGFAVNSNDLAFMWSVINTGSNTATILAATAHTIVGSAAVAGGSSGRFTTRRTAANTYVTYRLS